MKIHLFLGSVLMLGAALIAQEGAMVVHPGFATAKEGVSRETRPFGVRDAVQARRSFRWQQVHTRLATKALAIRSLTFRRDGAQRFDWEPYTVTLELSLSTSPRDHKNADILFKNNVGPDARIVVARKKISFPAAKNTSALPEPFAFTIPFDSGRTFPLAAGKNLCWEAKVYDNDLYQASQEDRTFDSVTPSSDGVFAYYGDGCFAPGMYRSFWGMMNFQFDQPGDRFLLHGEASEGPMGGFLFALVSAGRLSSGLPFGAPHCRFWIDPGAFLVSGLYFLDYKGYARISTASPILTMPNAAAHYGFNLYGQWVAVDRNLTSIYLSNGVKVQKGFVWKVCEGPEVARIYNQGVGSTTGFVANFEGLVVGFGT